MAIIAVTLPSDNTGADVADYNTPITTIVSEMNGKLDGNNMASSVSIPAISTGALSGISDTDSGTIYGIPVKDGYLKNLDGWINPDETWTYASASTFTVSGDQTAKYTRCTRIKMTQTTVKYFKVLSSSYAAPNTTVTVSANPLYTIANAAITNNYYSYSVNPQGYPATCSAGSYINVYKNATQSVPATTATKITWNAATSGYDSSLLSLASNDIVINSDDVKSVKCDLFYQIASSAVAITYVYKNGAQIAALGRASYDSGSMNSITVNVAKNDTISFYIYLGSGPINLTAASDWNHATVTINENNF